MQHNNSQFKRLKSNLLTLITGSVILCATTNASDLTVPNTFAANQPAVAAEVNENFDAVETSVDDNNSRLADLEALIVSMQGTINQLQSDLSAVENNTVLELDGLLQYALIDGHDTAEFTNVNVQINDGSGDTDGAVNGKGNLTIGYHEENVGALFFCSDPQYADSAACSLNSEIWANNVRTGSHNLISGSGHSYTSYSAIISGNQNISNEKGANVLAGENNNAAGSWSTILGGNNNTTLGIDSIVSGGSNNTASATASAVAGGFENVADGKMSSISGGHENRAVSVFSSISGGFDNEASGFSASISGGSTNIATGQDSHVSGGENNTASGDYSTVSGGNGRSATGTDDWTAGSLEEDF